MILNKEYKESNAISQSLLKAVLNGLGSYKKTLSTSNHFLLGDAVDILLTESREVFEEFYHVSDVKKPTDNLVKICSEMIKYYPFKDLESEYKTLLRICREGNYYNNLKNDKAEKVKSKYLNYWNDLIKSEGKPIIGLLEYETISKVTTSLKTNKYTKHIFNLKPHEEALSQLDIYFDYKELKCKALLDRVILNHKDKTIQPIDIKTIGDYTTNFKKSILKYRYDIQAAWYTLALEKKYMFSEYTILPFQFLVESTVHPGYNPLIYTCSEMDLLGGKYGISSISNYEINNLKTIKKNIYKGYENAIEEYKWYEEHGFEEQRKIYENKGVIPINLWE